MTHTTIPISQKCPPSIEATKHRNAQLNNVERVRDLGTFSLKWENLKFSPEGSENFAEEEAKCNSQWR